MIICICNNLNEKDIKSMSLAEYQAVKCCGICEEDVTNLIQVSRKEVYESSDPQLCLNLEIVLDN